MKKIIIGIFICCNLFALDNKFGLGVFNKNSKYIGGKDKIYPFFNIDYKNIYVQGGEIGYSFEYKKGKLKPFIKKDSTEGFEQGELNGENATLHERKSPVLLGLKYDKDFGKANLECSIYRDFSSEGNSARVDFSYTKELLMFLYFLPKISIVYSDENYTDYFYGISNEESAFIGHKYKDLNDSIRGEMQLGMAMFFSKQLGLYFSYNLEHLDKNSYNESLIKKSNNESFTLMSFYRF